ncbi:LysR family transcriptional regulator [Eikenella sp. S3360]|uniref:LysR family transcriptional regulator n=1 Tax=Eikenella glucosivorans TaxID=2766967 RepID=A0ABS0N9Q6_9NEIS|nr:LysR family transcriptional regulator [Eikenella glucosivorans]MBH5329046.1 LysR family transcriptional regulator [Eikenella glucosivorans]
MQDFRAMAIFAEVVKQQSMQRTADKLGLTVSTVSLAVSKLEKALDIKLLNRTTRRIGLTEAGEQFYQGCLKMLAGADEAMQAAAAQKDELAGTVRIAVFSAVVNSPVVNAIRALEQDYPKLNIELDFAENLVDLYQGKIDLALRGGAHALDNPQLIAKKLTDIELLPCATPEFLAEQPPVKTPDDLQALPWICALNDQGNPAPLQFTHRKTGEQRWITPNARTRCNNSLAAFHLMTAHLGVNTRVKIEVEQALANGTLVHLLPDWQTAQAPFYLVMLNREQPKKVRVVVERLMGMFAQQGVIKQPSATASPKSSAPASP